MQYATLMVHLDLEHSNDARLDIATNLAEKLDARLIGIAASDPMPTYYAGGVVASALVEQERQEIKRKISHCEDWFRTVAQARVKSFEWRSALAGPAAYVAHEARCADVVIAGTNRDEILNNPLRRLDSGDLLMQVGRPMLVVPPEAEQLDLDSALVGWKDTLETRRAVWGALPLLKRAGEVTVVELIERDGEHARATRRVEDVRNWLGAHGIQATARVVPAVGEVADHFDTIASELGADLIVAGAYGHSRLREWVFGGVTRGLLQTSPRCSLLAH